MQTLKNQILKINEQLEINKQTNDVRHVLREYETISAPLIEIGGLVSKALGYFEILQYLPEDAPVKMKFSNETDESAKNTLYSLELFWERWKKDKHESRQGNDLINLKNTATSLSKDCLDEIKHCWGSWLKLLFSSFQIESALLESQKNIPGMMKVYGEFKLGFNRFMELGKKLPPDKETISEIKKLHDELTQLRGQMQFELPAEVKLFFDELNNFNRSISLSMLTPKVFEWLKENNMLDEYVLSRKGQF